MELVCFFAFGGAGCSRRLLCGHPEMRAFKDSLLAFLQLLNSKLPNIKLTWSDVGPALTM